MLCACRPVGINSYLKAERISMSKSIQVACECWEREIRSLQAISFTNQVVFSLRPEKDAYGVRAILPRPEGRGLSRFLVIKTVVWTRASSMAMAPRPQR